MKKILMLLGIIISVFIFTIFRINNAQASYHFSNYKGRPPIHVLGGATKTPGGITPAQIKVSIIFRRAGERARLRLSARMTTKRLKKI